uniref:Uncharacterized protein n=1 Tax=Oryza rufipogon TaxID=4529 RepID=A0A0E0QND4_ORYRU
MTEKSSCSKIPHRHIPPLPISLFRRPPNRQPPRPQTRSSSTLYNLSRPRKKFLPKTLVPHHQHHVSSEEEGGSAASSGRRELYCSIRCSYVAGSAISIWGSRVPAATDSLACFSTATSHAWLFCFPSSCGRQD